MARKTRPNPPRPVPVHAPAQDPDRPVPVGEQRPTGPGAQEAEQLSLSITGFKFKVSGRTLLVLAVGVAAAMGGTIAVRLLI